MSKSKVAFVCPRCGKEREIFKQHLTEPNFRGFCWDCHMKRLHEKRRNRPMSDRPVLKRKTDGYLEIILPETHWCYPMASKARHSILVHRLVMAEYLKRLLEPWEIVHHINGIRDDNRGENLQLVSRQSHQQSYQDGYMKGFKDGITIRDKSLEKQIKLLQWQIKELVKSSQSSFGV